jgi:hypothetical protein
VGLWRLKLRRSDGMREADRVFDDLRALLLTARSLRTQSPELRLIVTVPVDASEDDRSIVRQIANPVTDD